MITLNTLSRKALNRKYYCHKGVPCNTNFATGMIPACSPASKFLPLSLGAFLSRVYTHSFSL